MEYYTARFKNIEKLDYPIEVVTPLFLGGSNPSEPELRTAPFKGMLRFWWRALYGSDNLAEMKDREAEIFGSTINKSNINVSIESQPLTKSGILPRGKTYESTHNRQPIKGDILKYLSIGAWNRTFIEPGNKLSLLITTPQKHVTEIQKAFKFLLLFGGIGSKSRNGFGCLRCDRFIKQEFSDSFSGKLKAFTAISEKTELFSSKSLFKSWEDALSDIGIHYYIARQKLDVQHHRYDNRSMIGLPIVTSNEPRIKNGRHSKPYFLHVTKISGNQYRGQILFLPYKYYDVNLREDYMKVCHMMNKELSRQFAVNQGGGR